MTTEYEIVDNYDIIVEAKYRYLEKIDHQILFSEFFSQIESYKKQIINDI